jgi:hypothetical protein
MPIEAADWWNQYQQSISIALRAFNPRESFGFAVTFVCAATN